MAEYTSLGDFFGAIANAIRDKKGTTDKIIPINFPQEIASIEVGGGSSGGSGVDSWIAGETTELTYSGETIANGTFSKIDSSASYYQNKITKFNGPNVKTIGSYAFYKRTELTEVNLPNLETVDAAFMYCTGLKSVSFPKLKRIEYGLFSQNSGIVSVDFPNLEYLGSQTFDSCKNLVMSELPKNLTFIGESCFYNCPKVTFNEIPEGVTELDANAFYNCTGLTHITLPTTLNKVNNKTFNNCTGLKEVTFKVKPSLIGFNAFTGCTQTDLVINVPWSEGSVSSAPWGATNATINYNYTG